MQKLYRLVREEHAGFDATGPHADEINRVAQSMAGALDAINTLRNQASVAHPNDDLLDEAEATLAINAGRTLLNYVAAKIG